MSMTLESYRKTLLEHGIAAEVQSSEHMAALCEAVFAKGSKADQVARRVVEHGRFVTTQKLANGKDAERHLLVMPPDKDVVRSVVSALMPLSAGYDKTSLAAMSVLHALRPSGGEPRIKVPVERLRLDSLKNVQGDIASAYSAHLLAQSANKRPAVRSVEVDGSRWVVVGGWQQGKAGGRMSDVYIWDAAEVVRSKPSDPDEWHFYYGRPVTVAKKRAFLGRRVKFVPDRG